MSKSLDRLSSLDRPSEFFVEAVTPTLGDQSARIQRAVTMGDVHAQIDFLDPLTPEIRLQLLAKKLLLYVGTTVLFYAAFTIVFFVGIPVETIYETIGTSKKSEERVETFNTYSGYAGAFVEVLVAMHVDKFMPVLDVYVHNALYFLQKARAMQEEDNPATGKTAKATKVSGHLHRAILFSFPIVLALTIGNSLRSLQAGQSTDGFKRIMSAADLKKEQPALELIKEAARNKSNISALSVETTGPSASDTILKNAIRLQSAPFTFYAHSPCSGVGDIGNGTDEATADLIDAVVNSVKTANTVQLSVHDLASTSVTYGFIPQEWNGEAIPNGLAPKSTWTITYQDVVDALKVGKTLPSPSEFSLATAYEMMVQGKLLIERAQGDTLTDTYPCWWTDNRTELDGLAINSSGAAAANKTTAKVTKNVALPFEATRLGSARHPSSKIPKHIQSIVKRRRLLQQTDGSATATDEGSSSTGSKHEQATAAAVNDSKNQWTFDKNGVRQCQGAVSSLFDMFDFDDPAFHTTENLVVDTARILNKTFSNLSLDETSITLEKYELTPQIQLEVIRITVPIDQNVSYGLNAPCPGGASDTCDPMYAYNEGLQASFCGSSGCAFLDNSKTMNLQREIRVVPYVVNCSLDAEHVHYSSDFRGYFPSDCTKVPNAAFLYGIGSFITGDEYGSNDTRLETYAPYITNARRHLRFTFAKVAWTKENLADRFNANCGDGTSNTADCTGLWYQLQPSGRFLFAGDDALPLSKLMAADLRSPISLVQLNSPKLFVDKFNDSITLEPLNPSNFRKVKWAPMPGVNGSAPSALGSGECSMLIDSYLRQVSDNNYALEQPLQTMYTAFFYYLMQNAAVTQLNDTTLALNGSTAATSQATIALSMAEGDRLGNVKLKGDKQRRSIRVSIPPSSYHTTIGGCIVILVLMLLVIVVPARRVEHFDEGASAAQEFVKIRSDEDYADSVHKKTLLFPATGEIVDFGELEIERLALVHETEKDRFVHL